MTEGPKHIFALGDTVRITAGTFTGFVGRLEEIDAATRRAIVIVRNEGRSMPVGVGIDDIEHVSD